MNQQFQGVEFIVIEIECLRGAFNTEVSPSCFSLSLMVAASIGDSATRTLWFRAPLKTLDRQIALVLKLNFVVATNCRLTGRRSGAGPTRHWPALWSATDSISSSLMNTLSTEWSPEGRGLNSCATADQSLFWISRIRFSRVGRSSRLRRGHFEAFRPGFITGFSNHSSPQHSPSDARLIWCGESRCVWGGGGETTTRRAWPSKGERSGQEKQTEAV